MNTTLTKALVALVPVTILLVWSLVACARRRTLGPIFLALGACGFTMVVFTHLCEGLRVLTFMHWGEPHSAGHYLDLSSATLALVLVPVGFVLLWRDNRKCTPSR